MDRRLARLGRGEDEDGMDWTCLLDRIDLEGEWEEVASVFVGYTQWGRVKMKGRQ